MTDPSTRAPGTMSFIRFSERRNVDLPQPDGPMSAVTWFGRILTWMLLEDAALAVIEVQPGDVDFGGCLSRDRPGSPAADSGG